jgi:hypothetical protein
VQALIFCGERGYGFSKETLKEMRPRFCVHWRRLSTRTWTVNGAITSLRRKEQFGMKFGQFKGNLPFANLAGKIPEKS